MPPEEKPDMSEPRIDGPESYVGRLSTHADGEPKTVTLFAEEIQTAADAEATRSGYASPSLISDTRTEMDPGEGLLRMQILENRVRILEATLRRLMESQHRDMM
jgi:hypothetical protein